MHTTTAPTAERSVTIIRRHARRPHSAPQYPAWQDQVSSEQPVAVQTSRSLVLDGFRRLARGTDASTAEEQTKAFYRASGQAWAHSLTEQGSYGVKARVLEAFRGMAHGVQDVSAHAKTLQFYRSGGQDWARNLG